MYVHLYVQLCGYRSGGGRGRGAGEGHDLLDGEPQLEAVQRVADANLTLDLRVRQRRHDGTTLHVGTARRHVPRWHAHPQLAEQSREREREREREEEREKGRETEGELQKGIIEEDG